MLTKPRFTRNRAQLSDQCPLRGWGKIPREDFSLIQFNALHNLPCVTFIRNNRSFSRYSTHSPLAGLKQPPYIAEQAWQTLDGLSCRDRARMPKRVQA